MNAPTPDQHVAPLVPRATYRLQFHAGFRLTDALALVPRLAALGISHLYASPLLKARPGSTHGYDGIDFDALNPEIGSDAEFDALCAALREHGMGLLLDIVPNHMGVLEADNVWWLDVLENGPAARHARAFDIEWQPPQRELRGKLLLAVLGKPYGEALEAGELQLVFEPARGLFVLHYFTHRFPIDPVDHAGLLLAAPLPPSASADDAAHIDALAERFGRLPPRDTPDPLARAIRERDATALKRELAQLHAESQAERPWAADWLDACAAALQGRAGEPASFDALDALLARQAWRLTHWRAAGAQINYRRFFDINALAGLRVEDADVFEAAHRRVFAWLAAGRTSGLRIGLRIDHPDGMADPSAYFDSLQRRCAEVQGEAPADGGRSVYLVAEKILAEDEPWPREWPVHGDTGYRFANQANGVFVDGDQAAAFDALYADFIGAPVDFDAGLDAAKRSIMTISLGADLRLLTELAHDIALLGRHTRDLTRDGLRDAIVEFAAAFEVYRSYVSARGAGPLDVARVERCAAAARARIRPSQVGYVDFIRQLMLQPAARADADADVGAAADDAADRRPALTLRFAQRLQQFTAPVMAKSMEDTVFYRHLRLLSLNDVGGDPRRFGMRVADFHAANAQRLRDMPHTLLGTSTHDSKRSEDVRARLDVLSELPERWAETLRRWHALAQVQWRMGGRNDALEPTDELRLYQTLVGVWPVELADDAALGVLRERVQGYMQKAMREAKQTTSWLDGNDDYEAMVQRCVDQLLGRLEPNPFLSDLRRFVADIAPFGCCNSLGLVALKLTSPGVPDLYQGAEDWLFALVDPDNRRPIDFGAIEQRLRGAIENTNVGIAEPGNAEPLPGGAHKLLVTRQLLRWRAQAQALFCDGDYRPLTLSGEHAAHVLAFARCDASGCSLTVVTRLGWRLSGGDIDRLRAGACWGDTAVQLPIGIVTAPDRGEWVDAITGRCVQAVNVDGAPSLRIRELLGALPVAVLHLARRSLTAAS